MSGIPAIETRYKGYRFRSRLEARWAVFFDALSIEWEYEKEGYDLGEAGWYLPDFWLPSLRCFIEIKPRDVCDGNKAAALAELGNHEVYVMCGMPGPDRDYVANSYEGFYYTECGEDFPYYWCECPRCGAIGIQFDGRAERNHHSPSCTLDDRHYHNTDSPRLLSAYARARSARFEHGEHGL